MDSKRAQSTEERRLLESQFSPRQAEKNWFKERAKSKRMREGLEGVGSNSSPNLTVLKERRRNSSTYECVNASQASIEVDSRSYHLVNQSGATRKQNFSNTHYLAVELPYDFFCLYVHRPCEIRETVGILNEHDDY